MGKIKKDDVKAVFKQFDLNGDGFINKPELHIVLRSLDSTLDDEKINTLLAAADQNSDSRISYDEFLNWVMKDDDPLKQDIKAGVSPLKILVEMLGEKLTSKDGEVSTEAALEGKYIGLYFSAHWCPPCTMFTPMLEEAYKNNLKAKNLEIVFLSLDRDEAAFNEYYAMMPWLAVQYGAEGHQNRVQRLMATFNCGGIPSLVILGSDAACITTKGREKVMEDLDGFPWLPDPEDRTRCDKIFEIYDEDKNGFLDLKETQKLALETGGNMREEVWPMMCGALGIDPKKGMTPDELYSFYMNGGGSIKKDYEIVCDEARRKRFRVVAAAREASHIGEEQLMKIFDAYDPEKDLSKEDFSALWKSLAFQEEYLDTYFAAIDENGNGVISFKELLGGLTVCSGVDVEKTAELLMKVYDTKSTGFLDREEFDAALSSSCKVMKAAVTTALQGMVGSFAEMGIGVVVAEAGPDGGPAEPTGEPPGPPDEETKKKLVESMLADFPLPKAEEFKEAFDQIDADTDGKLTLPELTKALGENPNIKGMMLPQVGARQLKAMVSPMGCPMM
mmetsp:Transcript_16700/g.30812  ORF Transcript_16700/g.30812 Transcript_16700/m.30812 type:complete len:560 (-) Transcript_16700:76-1755(-)